MGPKRILHILGGLNQGGIESFVMNVYRSIDRTRYQFDFLVTRDGFYGDEIRTLGGRIFVHEKRSLRHLFRYYRSLRTFFEEHKGEFCAVHMHAATLSAVQALKYAKDAGIPVRIIHAHSSTVKTSKIHYLFHYFNKKRLGSLATHYFACSKAALHWFYDYSLVKKQARIINNGIDSSRFLYDENLGQSVREELDIPDDYLVIGHVGSFIKVKNHIFLLNVFAELKKIQPDSFLVLVGDGVLRPDIEKKIKDLNLANSVRLLGLRSDVNRILKAVDVVVMPSLYEGMPVSLIEAQAADCAVVCSDTISSDTKITDSFVQIPLDSSSEYWARIIKSVFQGYKRKNTQREIIAHGFDVNSTASILIKEYVSEI